MFSKQYQLSLMKWQGSGINRWALRTKVSRDTPSPPPRHSVPPTPAPSVTLAPGPQQLFWANLPLPAHWQQSWLSWQPRLPLCRVSCQPWPSLLCCWAKAEQHEDIQVVRVFGPRSVMLVHLGVLLCTIYIARGVSLSCMVILRRASYLREMQL